MDQALLTVAAGMKAQVETLELLGNNIANASTAGYKRDNEFHRLFITEQAQAAFFDEDPAWMPVVEGSKIDYRQGPLQPTEATFDVALMGPGFLAVRISGSQFYTRNGHLTLSAAGRLTTLEGHPVLDTQEREIILPAGARIDIGSEGMISVDGSPIAQLAIVEFDGAPPLRKAGASFFQAAAPDLARPATDTTVRQGHLEASNVNAPLSAVRLMLATRNFQMLRQAASLIGEEMNGRAIDELGSFGR
jgi:flagellar basal body rod protein FlgG